MWGPAAQQEQDHLPVQRLSGGDGGLCGDPPSQEHWTAGHLGEGLPCLHVNFMIGNKSKNIFIR